jgi:hypothetical protein
MTAGRIGELAVGAKLLAMASILATSAAPKMI